MIDLLKLHKEYQEKYAKLNDHAKLYEDKLASELATGNKSLYDAELSVQRTYTWDLLEIIEKNLKQHGLPFHDRMSY